MVPKSHHRTAKLLLDELFAFPKCPDVFYCMDWSMQAEFPTGVRHRVKKARIHGLVRHGGPAVIEVPLQPLGPHKQVKTTTQPGLLDAPPFRKSKQRIGSRAPEVGEPIFEHPEGNCIAPKDCLSEVIGHFHD